MSARKIIALSGLSGAGKTTLLERVVTHGTFQLLSASALIRENLKLQGTLATSEGLRVGDVSNNQVQLAEAFRRRASESSQHIILDCHTLIDTPRGLEMIPAETFSALGITNFLFLSVTPAQLVERRTSDSSRGRPIRSEIELAQQQEIALSHAKSISGSLGIPLLEVRDDPERELSAFLKTI